MVQNPITVLAPAKINLYLHILSRRDDGYHLLDSLVTFADFGDRIIIQPAGTFEFTIEGPYAGAFSSSDRVATACGSNLVVRAAREAAGRANKKMHFNITLQKNLPLASGIGGGSADAAAALWGLLQLWEEDSYPSWLPAMALGLGADVPVCLRSAAVRMSGIGERHETTPNMPLIPVVLLNPLIPCPTAEVFRRHKITDITRIEHIPPLDTADQVIDFLESTQNDLTKAAIDVVPQIAALTDALDATGSALTRMSGSGASVFGLYVSDADAHSAALEIRRNHPEWWVQPGHINMPGRF